MTKEWVEAKNAELEFSFEKQKKLIRSKICDYKNIEEEHKKKLLDEIDSLEYGVDSERSHKAYRVELDIEYAFLHLISENKEDFEEWEEFYSALDVPELEHLCSFNYDNYVDSEPVSFDGDIIITDPCYIMRKDHEDIDDWGRSNCGYEMERIGIDHFMTRDTLYGDWSCTVFDCNTAKPIGEFCADAGLVSVMGLSEVLAYNPDFHYHTDGSDMAAVIKDFKGTVQFIVKRTEGIYEDDTEYHKKGEMWEDYSVIVEGRGVNKVTGEEIHFESHQTGF